MLDRPVVALAENLKKLGDLKPFLVDFAGVTLMGASRGLFELVANARKARIHGIGFYVVTHVYGEETQGFRCWFDGQIVHFAESDIRPNFGAVRDLRQNMNTAEYEYDTI